MIETLPSPVNHPLACFNANARRRSSNSRSTCGNWSYNGRRKNSSDSSARSANSTRTFTRSEARKEG